MRVTVPSLRGRGQRDDRLAAARARGAADEVDLAADAARRTRPIESAQTWPVRSTASAELIATMPSLLRDDERVVGEVGRAHLDDRVVVDPVVERAAAHARTTVTILPGWSVFARPVMTPRLDERIDAVGEHLGVDAEVVAVAERGAAPRPGSRRCPV